MTAVFFDVGDTLVENWSPRERVNDLTVELLRREFGERDWYEPFLAAKLGPIPASTPAADDRATPSDERLRQETLRWYEEWFRNRSIGIDDLDLERLRLAATVPLDLVSTLVRGAGDALKWCKEQDLQVVLVTNTLSRGDEEVRTDWQRFGLGHLIDAVVSSHSVGWQKPHRAIFDRALALAGAAPHQAVMVGDRTDADVLGAKRLGLRAVLRRTDNPGAMDDVGVVPDAVIGDLTELPGVLWPWLGASSAHPGPSEKG